MLKTKGSFEVLTHKPTDFQLNLVGKGKRGGNLAKTWTSTQPKKIPGMNSGKLIPQDNIYEHFKL